MYKLPNEIKKVLLISCIVAVIITIILLVIKPIFILFFIMGYLASVFNIWKNNYLFSMAVFNPSNSGNK